MTCYNCNKCGRYQHISNMGEYEVKKRIGKIVVTDSIWLCKLCLTKAGIKYSVTDNWIFVNDKREANYTWKIKEAQQKQKDGMKLEKPDSGKLKAEIEEIIRCTCYKCKPKIGRAHV